MNELQEKAFATPFSRADNVLPTELTEIIDGNWLVGLSINK